MVSTGLLIMTTPLRALSSHVCSILQIAHAHVKKTLYIHLQPRAKKENLVAPLNPGGLALLTGSEKCALSKLVSLIYTSAHNTCQDLDVRIMLDDRQTHNWIRKLTKKQFEIILTNYPQNLKEFNSFLSVRFVQNTENLPVVHITIKEDEMYDESMEVYKVCQDEWKDFDSVVLGGTFDHLHCGHKILLSEAIIRCKKKMTIGITDDSMISQKVLPELIMPTSTRIQELEDFLQEVGPPLEYVLMPISDAFGPSIVDPDLECIVVSDETIKGGQLVNQERLKKDLNRLEIIAIGLIADLHRQNHEEVKISSSTNRLRMLGKRLNTPKPKPEIPAVPYVVGLTGGIASGKSSIAKRLEKLGMTVLSADQIAHSTYLPGSEIFDKIVSEFGCDVIGSNGMINRKILGGKVFADKQLLTKLNEIVWPAVEAILEKEIKRLGEKGVKFILLENPVLIESKMTRLVHEVWVSVIPKSEAVRRIVRRDSLSPQQAEQRIDSQISNQARVAEATVVFSSFWDYEITQKQVETAWNELNDYLKQKGFHSSHGTISNL